MDGAVWEAPIELWPDLPGEGVDTVTVYDAHGSRTAQAKSLYWVYPESDAWVVGEGCVRYDPHPLTEVVYTEAGSSERRIDYMPDLMLRQVKLGWWWPGKPRPWNG